MAKNTSALVHVVAGSTKVTISEADKKTLRNNLAMFS